MAFGNDIFAIMFGGTVSKIFDCKTVYSFPLKYFQAQKRKHLLAEISIELNN